MPRNDQVCPVKMQVDKVLDICKDGDSEQCVNYYSILTTIVSGLTRPQVCRKTLCMH